MGTHSRPLKRLIKIRDTRAFVGGAIFVALAILFGIFSLSVFDKIVGWKALTGLIGVVFLVMGIALITTSFRSRRMF
jgi:uncharacterized membrane protein HdeD (DUF308 family)